MLRSIVAVALVGLILGLAPAPTAGADNPWFDERLRTWAYTGPIEDRHPLKLAPTEDYQRYYFGFVDPGHPVIGEILVKHAATGDLVCGKKIVQAAGVMNYLRCDEIEVGRTYHVFVKLVIPTETALWGVNP